MSNKLTDAGVLVLRLIFGLSMAFGHGLGKMPPSEKWIESVGTMGFPLPFVFAWAASLSEFLGGLLIAVGLFTRPSAAMWVLTMGTAAFLRHADDPFSSKEKALLYFAVGVCLLFTGAGRYSISKLLFKTSKSELL